MGKPHLCPRLDSLSPGSLSEQLCDGYRPVEQDLSSLRPKGAWTLRTYRLLVVNPLAYKVRAGIKPGERRIFGTFANGLFSAIPIVHFVYLVYLVQNQNLA